MATAAASIDPNARLPRQIRERMARIAALSNTQDDGSPQTTLADGAPQPGSPTANPPAANGVPADSPNPIDSAQPDLRPFHDPALNSDPRAADPNYWRQRLSVMQGKLAEERRASDAREAALRTQLTELEGQIKTLKTSAPAQVDVKTMFSQDQLDALGEDHAAAIASAAVTAARKQVDATLEEQRVAAAAETARNEEQDRARRRREFLDRLEEQIPDWQTIDARQDWRQWLGEIDPATRADRQTALTAGIEAGDVKGVARIFQAFNRTLAGRPTPPAVAHSDANAPGGEPPAPPAPGDRSLVAPTDAEIKAFYKDSKLGKVKEAERIAFEKRLALL